MKSGLFVTGTTTGIGKTVVSALLVSACKQSAREVGYFKPVQTGLDDDAIQARELSGIDPDRIAPPVYRFSLPAAPSRAAEAEGKIIQLETFIDRWHSLSNQIWIIEGAGGLLVPLTNHCTIRDLVRTLELPLLIVASTQLGTINHTLLTVEAAAAAAINIRGIALVGPKDQGLKETLSSFTDVPVIAEIPWFTDLSASVIQREALRFFPPPITDQLLISGKGK